MHTQTNAHTRIQTQIFYIHKYIQIQAHIHTHTNIITN